MKIIDEEMHWFLDKIEIITCDPLKLYKGPSWLKSIKLYGKFH